MTLYYRSKRDMKALGFFPAIGELLGRILIKTKGGSI
jgi:hypothetical protein